MNDCSSCRGFSGPSAGGKFGPYIQVFMWKENFGGYYSHIIILPAAHDHECAECSNLG